MPFKHFIWVANYFKLLAPLFSLQTANFDKDVLRGGSAVLVPYRSIPVPDLDHPHIDCS